MPTYDYVCGACDHKWESFESIKAKPTRKCPECGKLKAKRQIGPGAGIIFRGSGFYQTDYRSASYKKGAEADKTSSSSSSDSKSDGGSASKSDSGGSKPKEKKAASGE